MEHIFDKAPGRTGYRNGCRCEACREDYVIDRRERNRRHRAGAGPDPLVSGSSAARRLLALRADGWMCDVLGERMGVSPQRVSGLSLGWGDLVSLDTDRRVAVLYDDLKDQPGSGTVRARRGAVLLGGFPPSCWDGINMVEPTDEEMSVVQGRMAQMTIAERHKSGGGSEMRATALEGSTLIPDEHRRPAALTVAAHSRDVDEARDLLTMLGLLEEAA